MRATHELHELGRSLWLDRITRNLLASEGAISFVKSRNELMAVIASKNAVSEKVG